VSGGRRPVGLDDRMSWYWTAGIKTAAESLLGHRPRPSARPRLGHPLAIVVRALLPAARWEGGPGGHAAQRSVRASMPTRHSWPRAGEIG